MLAWPACGFVVVALVAGALVGAVSAVLTGVAPGASMTPLSGALGPKVSVSAGRVRARDILPVIAQVFEAGGMLFLWPGA